MNDVNTLMLDDGPGYWMHETSGVLRPAVEALLLEAGPLSPEHIAALRAYLRQWIMAPVWDQNPHADEADRKELAALRSRIDELTSREAIERFIDDAGEFGIDPM